MSGRQRTDEQLIERARRGDRDAQQELWRTHRRWVAAIIIAHRPRTEEVEDLMQDVAVKFISKVHTLRDSLAFRPWLRQIALNVCRGAARTSKTYLRLGGPQSADGSEGDHLGFVGEPAGDGPEALEQIQTGDEAARLLGQALTLPVAYREPLLLRCVRALSYQQISEILDLPITTVETRLARARRMLREEIGDEEPSDPTSEAQRG